MKKSTALLKKKKKMSVWFFYLLDFDTCSPNLRLSTTIKVLTISRNFNNYGGKIDNMKSCEIQITLLFWKSTNGQENEGLWGGRGFLVRTLSLKYKYKICTRSKMIECCFFNRKRRCWEYQDDSILKMSMNKVQANKVNQLTLETTKLQTSRRHKQLFKGGVSSFKCHSASEAWHQVM